MRLHKYKNPTFHTWYGRGDNGYALSTWKNLGFIQVMYRLLTKTNLFVFDEEQERDVLVRKQ